jgi:hypothetical protein
VILRRLKRIVRPLFVHAAVCPRVPTSSCFYSRLGLYPGASLLETRKAYEAARLAKLHPVAQRLVDEAYAVLSDPVRREIYLLVRRGLVASGLAADSLQAGAERSLLRVLRDLARRVRWRVLRR